jgi:hypothetical protein
MQENERIIARLFDNVNGSIDLAQGRHAGRDDHRLAHAGNMVQVSQVGNLTRRCFKCQHTQFIEKICTGLIERSG